MDVYQAGRHIAERLVRRCRIRQGLFTKFGRGSGRGRHHVARAAPDGLDRYCDPRIPRPLLWALIAHGDERSAGRFEPLCPIALRVPLNDLGALEKALPWGRTIAPHRRPIQGKGVTCRLGYLKGAATFAALRALSSRRDQPVLGRPGVSLPSSTGRRGRTWFLSPIASGGHVAGRRRAHRKRIFAKGSMHGTRGRARMTFGKNDSRWRPDRDARRVSTRRLDRQGGKDPEKRLLQGVGQWPSASELVHEVVQRHHESASNSARASSSFKESWRTA